MSLYNIEVPTTAEVKQIEKLLKKSRTSLDERSKKAIYQALSLLSEKELEFVELRYFRKMSMLRVSFELNKTENQLYEYKERLIIKLYDTFKPVIGSGKKCIALLR